ncbi:serine hydrolase [Sphingomonas sp. M1-B02]|uniref:serine hydrolase n=1 Tax=Sphingomonas sp. M1-B02 TaxID=3114300 RepID=UPI00223FACF1|nr:serine hydrolase [Sphingomonas sp. S6-11]UZK65458.1 serine hydrolase [Sphingomonas sp. S6-11]
MAHPIPSRSRLVSGATLLWLLTAPSIALADPPAEFERIVEDLRKSAGVPGMSIAIVENGKVTLAKGFGVRKLGAPETVTPDTIFPNGSTGKAFTVAALAVLVDQGKIGWDDKVIDRLPGFQMYDPWVTREMTIRDLLVHRSGLGLGAGDLLFVPSTNLTRKESVRRLRFIKPATSFRSGYAYDNILYMVAGQLIEEVSGQTWEAFVAEHVLRKGGMTTATTDDQHRFTTADRAHPHARTSGAFRGIGAQELLDERKGLGDNAAPAGGLAVSANDMARWLSIQLAQGKLPEGGQLYSPAQATEMWKPVVLQPTGTMPEAMKAAQPLFSTYALGWGVKDYKGARIISHGGAVFGFQATVVLIPEKNIGFAMMINSEDGETIQGLTYQLLDHYLGTSTQDWVSTWRTFKQQRQERALKALGGEAAKPAKAGPSLPLARYAGDFTDPWYGPISIRAERGKLHIDFKQSPGMTGTLEHWQYDSFRTRWDDKSFEPAYVNFGLNADGKVERITMKAVSPAADFSWDYHDLLFTPVVGPK